MWLHNEVESRDCSKISLSARDIPMPFSPSRKTLFTAGILTHQSRRSTGGIDNMMMSAFHLGELVLRSGIVHGHSLAWPTGTLIRMEPSLTSLVTPVLFLFVKSKCLL